MAELFDEVVVFVTRDEMLDNQARELGLSSPAPVRDAAVLAAVTGVAGFARLARTARGRAWLRAELPKINVSSLGRTDPTLPLGHERLGSRLAARLLGERREVVIARIASQTGLQPDEAAAVLGSTMLATLSHLARDHRAGVGVEELATELADEEADLVAAGWDPWIEQLGSDHDLLPATVAIATAGAAGSADSRSSSPEDGHRRSRTAILIPAVLLLLGLLAGGFWLLSDRNSNQVAGGGSAAPSSTAAGSTSDDVEASTTTLGADTTVPETSTTTSPPTAVEEIPDVAEYSISLADPVGVSDATGTVDLRFNNLTGEVCYAFDVTGVDTPFASHLHVGPTETQGGITVDFGQLAETSDGCVESHPADLIAAVSRPSERYVEVHDPSGAFSIRAQLADPQPGETPSEPVPDLDAGAYVALTDGALVLRGDVPDQETFDALVASVDDLDARSAGVVNELVISPDAPPPSGLFVIEDRILFDFDSDDVDDRALSTLAEITNVVGSRPSWSIVVVGNTDSTGAVLYNFELSLRRAKAVRQALIDLGYPALSVRIQGDGPFNPVSDNETEGGQAQNRRIELRVDTGR